MSKLLYSRYAWLAGAILFVSCQQEPKLPQSFAYVGHYYPSFIPDVVFSIRSTGNRGSLTRQLYAPYPDSTVAAVDSVPLTAADVRYFFAQLDGVSLLRLSTSDRPPGLDGITVYNEVRQDGQRNSFKFWSPTAKGQPQEYKVAMAVLGLARRKFTTPEQVSYAARLERYFRQ